MGSEMAAVNKKSGSRKLKVVFADPPFGRESKGEAVTESPNLGILYLIGYAKPRIEDVEFTYLEPFLSMEEHIEKVKAIKPDVYAISFTTPRRDLAFETIAKACEEIGNELDFECSFGIEHRHHNSNDISVHIK